MRIKPIASLLGGLLTATFALSQSGGQNYTISPYSNFGLGELINQNFIQAGANSQTHNGAYSYSLFNPATLANIRYATLDFGLNGRIGNVYSGDQTRNFNGGSFSYMSLAFNNWKKDKVRSIASTSQTKKRKTTPFAWNSGLSLYPGTSVGYNYLFESYNPFRTRTIHSGSGGVNVLELAQAMKLGNHISFGFSSGYMFGQIRDISVLGFPDSVDYQYIEDDKSVVIRGFQHRAGAMFSFGGDSARHTLGFSYGFHSVVKAGQTRLVRTLESRIIQNNLQNLYTVDTVLNIESGMQKITMPASFGLGYQFRYRRLFSVGVDYRKQLWGNYAAYFNPGAKLSDRTDYGFTITLNPHDEKPLRQKRMKMPIRFGGVMSETQNAFNGTGGKLVIQEQRAFIGFGIPISRRYFDNRVLRSIVHFQADYINRGENSNGLAREQYLVFSLSMNLGDIWFQRRKFD